MESKRILVTGGAGFLGSHLCSRLLDDGHTVVCVDNLSTGSPYNLEKHDKNPNFYIIPVDITTNIIISLVIDQLWWFDYHGHVPFGFEEIDQIYNLACPASPIHYQRDPIRTLKTNVMGAINMLEIARSSGARILQASTSEVYGDPFVHPQPEDYWGNVNPIGIRSCYDEGKRCAETLFFDYHRQHGVDIRVVRIFNTYGPNMQMDDGRVVSNFIVQALRGDPITIYGDGRQTRSFCYVDDMVNGLVMAMNGDEIGPINLGNPTEFTILQLAEEIIYRTGSKSKIVFKDLPEDDPRKRKPDISLARKALGWAPAIPLQIGLDATIEYFKHQELLKDIYDAKQAILDPDVVKRRKEHIDWHEDYD